MTGAAIGVLVEVVSRLRPCLATYPRDNCVVAAERRLVSVGNKVNQATHLTIVLKQ